MVPILPFGSGADWLLTTGLFAPAPTKPEDDEQSDDSTPTQDSFVTATSVIARGLTAAQHNGQVGNILPYDTQENDPSGFEEWAQAQRETCKSEGCPARNIKSIIKKTVVIKNPSSKRTSNS